MTGYNMTGTKMDAFIANYDSNGNQIWNLTWDVTEQDKPFDIVYDNNGYLYITGTMQNSNFKNWAFLAKYSYNGAKIWEKYFNYSKNDYGEALDINNNGEILIVGSTYSFSQTSNSKVFIAGFSPLDGTLLWFDTFGDSKSEFGYGIDIDINNNAFAISGQSQSYATDNISDALIIYYTLSGATTHIQNDEIIIINGLISGSLAGTVGALATVLSPPPSTTTQIPEQTVKDLDTKTDTKHTSSDRSEDIKIKKPGKWFKKKKFKMYLSALLIGTGLSITFLYFIYPHIISSSIFSIISVIIAPIGFFYALYDFIYVGFYQHKGNIYNAYYKNKKKFLFDVLSWLKPVLVIYAIIGNEMLFATLIGSNILSLFLVNLTISAGILSLLLFSIKYFEE